MGDLNQKGDELVVKKLEHWRSRLIDLSLRNSLLNFRMTRSTTMQFIEPGMSEVFEQLVVNNKPFTIICPEVRDELDSKDNGSRECLLREKITVLPGQILPSTINPNTEKVLYQTRLKARTFMQEQGINVLYLTFGLLRWIDIGDKERTLSAPILLLPVQLGKRTFSPYTLAKFGDDLMVNPSLEMKLRSEHGIELPPLPEDTDGMVLENYLKLVEAAIAKKDNWSVLRESYLGLFSFNKLVMFEDLKTNEDTALAHPVVRALSGDPSRLTAVLGDLTAADMLDESVRPRDTHHILDADSSQFEAVEAVRHGTHLVLQGPPGTGKSQTIANIIAECMWSGRTVLFVSEKMAALDVVKKRMDACGLGDYCLNLHSSAPNKGEVISALGRALEPGETVPEPDLNDLDRVANARDRLNAYVHFLNMRMGAQNMTLLDAHGQLAALNGVQDLPFRLDSVMDVSRQKMDEMESAIERLAARKDVMAARETHPWHDVKLLPLDLGKQQEFIHALGVLAAALGPLQENMAQLTSDLRVTAPRTLAGCTSLLGLLRSAQAGPSPPRNWLEAGQIDGLVQRAEAEDHEFKTLDSLRARLAAKYKDEFFELDGEHFRTRFSEDYRGSLRALSSDYRTDIKIISSHQRGPHRLEYEEALADVSDLRTYQAAKRFLNASLQEDHRLFGRFFDGAGTDWTALLAALRWTGGFMNEAGPLAPALADIVADKAALAASQELMAQCQARTDEVRAAMDRASSYMNGPWIVSGTVAKDAFLTDLQNWTDAHLTGKDRLREWIELIDAEDRLARTGLGDMVQFLRYGEVDISHLKEIFRKRFFTLFVDSARSQLPMLASFKGAEHDALIEDFRKLDQEQLLIARKRLAHRLHQRVQDMEKADPSAPVRAQETVLRKEMAKRTKQMAIRRLLSEIPDLLPIVKPCMMMSPISASQFIDPKRYRFDVVIFDEASQICPEDAVGPIMRGRQLVVVGDSRQLPPTRFFDKMNEEADEESQDLESILDECTTIGLPQRMLLWHYRSRSEPLIAFSNAHFYGNKLYTFPSADLSGPDGIDFICVPNGVYDRGGRRDNKIEAKRIADAVFEQFRAHPDQSLGVVAFSEEQQLAILDVIEYQKKTHPEFQQFFDEGHEESFFVKNLENVQGDERDIMFFSIGYGKDASGQMTMNFGPLNLEGGHRRLNVAITRARRAVRLFASVQPEDLDASSRAKGVVLLRRYMEFARSRGDKAALGAATKTAEPVARPLEDSIYQSLTSKGLEVHRDVGCSGYRLDMAVVDPQMKGRYLLGIECDGASYASGKTARDRDRLREQVLAGLGWRMHRIWSADWVEDRARELRTVDALLAKQP